MKDLTKSVKKSEINYSIVQQKVFENNELQNNITEKKQSGRPTTSEPINKRVATYLSEKEYNSLFETAGDIPISLFVRKIIREYLNK